MSRKPRIPVKEDNYLQKAVTGVLVFTGLFVAAMIALFCIFQHTPDTLIQCVLGGGAIELILTMALQREKMKREDKKNAARHSDADRDDPYSLGESISDPDLEVEDWGDELLDDLLPGGGCGPDGTAGDGSGAG
jgi:hypothetical protein